MKKAWKDSNLLKEYIYSWGAEEQEFEKKHADFINLLKEIIDKLNEILSTNEFTYRYGLELDWSGGHFGCGNYCVSLKKRPHAREAGSAVILDYAYTLFKTSYERFKNSILKAITEIECRPHSKTRYKDEGEVLNKLNKLIADDIDNKVKPLYEKGRELYHNGYNLEGYIY